MLNGKVYPGEVQNHVVLLDGAKFYSRSSKVGEAIHTPLREGVMDGRDVIAVPKAGWQLFKSLYTGKEIRRFSIVKNKLGHLHRPFHVPLIKTCIMRRGDMIRRPNLVPLQLRTTLE
jgi:hypothetical protein